MLNSWRSHCWQGPCEFGRSGDNTFTIQTDAADARAGWICRAADVDLALARPLVLHGSYHTGRIRALCYQGGEIIWSERLEPGVPFTPPPAADRLRIDLRLWDTAGFAEFRDIALSVYVEPHPPDDPDPPPDEDEEVPALPIPAVAEMQKHRIAGYKWGRAIFLFDLDAGEAGPGSAGIPAGPIPPQEYPWEVIGHQVGRFLDLEVTRPYEKPLEERWIIELRGEE